MTVQELIDELLMYDPEIEVVFDYDEHGFYNIGEVEEILNEKPYLINLTKEE